MVSSPAPRTPHSLSPRKAAEAHLLGGQERTPPFAKLGFSAFSSFCFIPFRERFIVALSLTPVSFSKIMTAARSSAPLFCRAFTRVCSRSIAKSPQAPQPEAGGMLKCPSGTDSKPSQGRAVPRRLHSRLSNVRRLTLRPNPPKPPGLRPGGCYEVQTSNAAVSIIIYRIDFLAERAYIKDTGAVRPIIRDAV